MVPIGVKPSEAGEEEDDDDDDMVDDRGDGVSFWRCNIALWG
jgi:hypothetical protein